MADQPEALRLANELGGVSDALADEAAAELRRLHAVNQELLEAMISFTNSAYIKKHHPKRYAAAMAAIAKAEGKL
jgi:NAD(P)H-dependent FMN reductase